MLYLALSCLQGRPMANAAAELLELGPVGLQLTPGCAPTAGFELQLRNHGISTRTHHGFVFGAARGSVWDGEALVSDSDSVHPPKSSSVSAERFFAMAEAGAFEGSAMETMYSGYVLGTGLQIERAMDLDLALAVDVSHVFIQLCSGVMTPATWERLQRYETIAEVHVSSNDGHKDQHRTVDESSFGLDWALERASAGTPLILESYLHHRSDEQRREEVAALINKLAHTENTHVQMV